MSYFTEIQKTQINKAINILDCINKNAIERNVIFEELNYCLTMIEDKINDNTYETSFKKRRLSENIVRIRQDINKTIINDTKLNNDLLFIYVEHFSKFNFYQFNNLIQNKFNIWLNNKIKDSEKKSTKKSTQNDFIKEDDITPMPLICIQDNNSNNEMFSNYNFFEK